MGDSRRETVDGRKEGTKGGGEGRPRRRETGSSKPTFLGA